MRALHLYAPAFKGMYYVLKDADQWRTGNWSGSCSRRVQLQCERNGGELVVGSEERDGFLRIENVKFPDFIDDHVGQDNAKEFENMCLQNCSCIAYSFIEGVNCMIWRNDLVDIQHFEDAGSPLFIRLPNSELGKVYSRSQWYNVENLFLMFSTFLGAC